MMMAQHAPAGFEQNGNGLVCLFFTLIVLVSIFYFSKPLVVYHQAKIFCLVSPDESDAAWSLREVRRIFGRRGFFPFEIFKGYLVEMKMKG